MGRNLEALIANPDEIDALEKYQDNYFKIVNTLLRDGTLSEETINSQRGSDYIPPSNEELKAALDNIKKIYSVITKKYLLNGEKEPEKPLYRGTQISLMEQMKNSKEASSFLSTATSINRTRTFSPTYKKNSTEKNMDDMAIVKIEGNAPWINMQEIIAGFEDEILFVPANFEIQEGISDNSYNEEKNKKIYGKSYTMRLSPLETTEMPRDDIDRLYEEIVEKNERMGKIINEIQELKNNPEGYDAQKVQALRREYSQWKSNLIKYCHQEFVAVQKEIETNFEKEEEIDEKSLTNKGSANLGGTGEMYIYQDANSNDYLFKPAISKFEEKEEPFRAEIQKAAYKVQKIVDPQSAVFCETISLDGRFGAIQQKVETDRTINLMEWQRNGGELPKEITDQLMREYVTDYLLCNYDSHGANFIIGKDGTLRGIDKEQSFRFLNNEESEKPSKDYHPNKKYKSAEPIYNTMFRRFSEGTLDIDLSQINSYMNRVDEISNKNYKEIFVDYAEQLHGENSEQMLDKIVGRKQNMRENFTRFFDDLKKERKQNKESKNLDKSNGTLSERPSILDSAIEATTKETTTKGINEAMKGIVVSLDQKSQAAPSKYAHLIMTKDNYAIGRG